MKTSNRILMITILSLLCVMILALIGIGISFFYHNPHLLKFVDGPAKPVNKEYEIKDFHSISLKGVCMVKITQEDFYSLSVKAPEKMIPYIILNVENKTLVIHQKYFSRVIDKDVELSITMPSLISLTVAGTNQVDFAGFSEDHMSLNSRGFNRITGVDSRISTLSLTGSDIIDYNLGSCTIVNARLALSGSGSTTLYMKKGTLEGTISGNISVIYTGDIDEERIKTYENAEIIKKRE